MADVEARLQTLEKKVKDLEYEVDGLLRDVKNLKGRR